MYAEAHWNKVFSTKAPDAVSWYRPHLEVSLDLIERRAAKSGSIIEVGAGESTLVDDLLARGSREITILDVSRTAIEITKERLGPAAEQVRWIVGDITQISLPFRFVRCVARSRSVPLLVDLEERKRYVQSVLNAVRPGGHVIVSAFGPEGPAKCSGLDVMRYDAEELHGQFGRRFRIEESSEELHRTPWGAGPAVRLLLLHDRVKHPKPTFCCFRRPDRIFCLWTRTTIQ